MFLLAELHSRKCTFPVADNSNILTYSSQRRTEDFPCKFAIKSTKILRMLNKYTSCANNTVAAIVHSSRKSH